MAGVTSKVYVLPPPPAGVTVGVTAAPFTLKLVSVVVASGVVNEMRAEEALSTVVAFR